MCDFIAKKLSNAANNHDRSGCDPSAAVKTQKLTAITTVTNVTQFIGFRP